ncbi:MAG TPA: maltose alpha-D-glucosyltransferase, partial [Anaerolineales bacterium]|nr:maltose alpha-D-glucosyltransferase [Anaerolineales bacterium]
MDKTNWYKDAVFYELSVRAFKDSNGDGHGDLRGLTERLDYLHELGVDCIWLMPIYPSPLRDDGYDIADYYNVAETFGTLDDFKVLIKEAHDRNIRIITDLVLNHTSDEHPWFKAARADRNSPYRDYYVWSDSDQKYQDTRIIFLDTEPSNWTWDEEAGQYFWHRFYSTQPDLNFDNPKVQEEMINIARFWLDLGIDGFRADAVPYLFEREGTNCENLPETHVYLKKLRTFMQENYPGRILLCEANQWPEDVRPYFGDGDEFHMGFHFPIMPRIFMALKKERADDMVDILNRTPAIPENCQWCIFLRNHDELTLEMVTEEERHWMWGQYAPEPRMKLNLGIRRRLAPLLDNDRKKIELINSLLFTLPGSPIIYYGDEIGMGDNIELFDRNGVRTPMQWDDSPNAGFTTGEPFAEVIIGELGYDHVNVASQLADKNSLFHAIKKMIQIRKKYPAFGRGSMEWVNTGNPTVAAYVRKHEDESLLILNNLSSSSQTITLPREYYGSVTNQLTEDHFQLESSLVLKP